jgi:hypothetical protein
MVVRFGNSLDDSVFGEFWILDQVGRELSFGLHCEILWNRNQALEL